MQWNEKCFFSKETPSLEYFSQYRRLKGQVDSIGQKKLAAWMERQAWKKSGKQRISILAEIIDA